MLTLQGQLALRLMISLLRNRLDAGELSRADARLIIDGALDMLSSRKERLECAKVLKESFPEVRIDTLRS